MTSRFRFNPRALLAEANGYPTAITSQFLNNIDELTADVSVIVGTVEVQTLTNKTMDGDDNTFVNIATESLKQRTGADVRVVTGTAGASGNFGSWNADGDMVGSGKAVPTGEVVGTSDTQTLTNKTLDGAVNTLTNVGTASLATKTGIDNAVVTGTAGSDGNIVQWNVDGDAVDSGIAIASVATKIEGSATYNPPNLADGAGVTTTVTVTGAALGDVALASFSLSTQGIIVSASVTAADTVSVRFQNETGGAIDLASGTLKAVVLK